MSVPEILVRQPKPITGTITQPRPTYALGSLIDISDLPPLHAKRTVTHMYCRRAVVDLLKCAATPNNTYTLPTIWMQGPPGTGKSHICLLRAAELSVNHAVCFAEVRESNRYLTLFRGARWWQFQFSDPAEFGTVVQACVNNRKYAVILDGVRHEDSQEIRTLAANVMNEDDPRNMLCTSKQLTLKDFSGRLLEPPTWSFEELVEAATLSECLLAKESTLYSEFEEWAQNLRGENEEEEDGDNPTANLRVFMLQKFRITGGSARMMFDLTTRSAMARLDLALSGMDDENRRAVLNGEIRDESGTTKNVLRGSFCSESVVESERYDPFAMDRCAISKYVMFKMRLVLDVKSSYTLMIRCEVLNRSMYEFAFEEYVLRIFEHMSPDMMSRDHDVVGSYVKITFPQSPVIVFKSNSLGLVEESGQNIALDHSAAISLIIRPDVPANPIWDSALLSRFGTEWTLQVHQMTIQTAHVVSEAYLWSLYCRCRDALKSANSSFTLRSQVTVAP